MALLHIRNLEKHHGDVLLFPAFDFTIEQGEVKAIFSSLNVRTVLLDVLMGTESSPNGKITINDKAYVDGKAAYLSQVGFLQLNAGIYTRLKVDDQLKFIHRLYGKDRQLQEVLQDVQLAEKRHQVIGKLSESEQRRVHYGSILLQNPALYVFEEPDLNVDVETKRVFIHLIEKLKKEGKGVLILTSNMESAITVTDHVYRLDEKGLHMVKTESSNAKSLEEEVASEEKTFQFHKIPTKINDKMVLFDPPEIDYIESVEGQVNLYINGDAFPTSFTLTELEERLMYFGFYRCHRSYIVNLQKVREVITWTRNSYSLILDDKPKSSIPLSKTKMTHLKDMLGVK
ncbi:LytTR family transcriptional regulator DNA-binding domain-containing protein [Virgibacillus sp. LDC-1]|uniref:LytTR family transcriptional regulator DNA-binding domain-containing protein n=1 Tax=Virgibacillus sp. LDC-1 TaxID=3039856 RepID=UPI0024DE976A|nr:LytTR family transcriptional regulator DNA-binding domain-containing protein [Virgibacillus sp. LDC-1]